MKTSEEMKPEKYARNVLPVYSVLDVTEDVVDPFSQSFSPFLPLEPHGDRKPSAESGLEHTDVQIDAECQIISLHCQLLLKTQEINFSSHFISAGPDCLMVLFYYVCTDFTMEETAFTANSLSIECLFYT